MEATTTSARESASAEGARRGRAEPRARRRSRRTALTKALLAGAHPRRSSDGRPTPGNLLCDECGADFYSAIVHPELNNSACPSCLAPIRRPPRAVPFQPQPRRRHKAPPHLVPLPTGLNRWEGAPTSVKLWSRVLLRDPCAYCGGLAWTVDHVEPSAAGGRHDPENLVGACAPCNSGKSDTPLLSFLLERAPIDPWRHRV
jgi:HNH endonuclease